MRLQKLNELSASERRVLVAALCVIGALAVYNWLVSPHVTSLHAAQRYERAASTVMNKGQAVAQQLDIKRQTLQRLLAEQASLAEGIFRPAEVEPFLDELERLCMETKCVLVSFSHAAKNAPILRDLGDANSPVLQKTAKLTLQAGYGNVEQFLEKLQTYRRKVWIDKLEISSAPPGVTCNLEISVYIHRSKENEGHG
jgi:hypothetical protein